MARTAAILRQQWAANGTRHAAVAGAGGGDSVQRIAMPQQGRRAHTPDAKPSCARCEATVVNAGAMGGGDLQARASWGEEQRPTHRVGNVFPPTPPHSRSAGQMVSWTFMSGRATTRVTTACTDRGQEERMVAVVHQRRAEGRVAWQLFVPEVACVQRKEV